MRSTNNFYCRFIFTCGITSYRLFASIRSSTSIRNQVKFKHMVQYLSNVFDKCSNSIFSKTKRFVWKNLVLYFRPIFSRRIMSYPIIVLWSPWHPVYPSSLFLSCFLFLLSDSAPLVISFYLCVSGPRARLSWHCQQLKLECSSRLPRSAETFRYDPWTLTLRTICGAFDGNNSKKWIGARESERLLPWSYRWWTLFGRLFFRECRISLRFMLQSLEREREI